MKEGKYYIIEQLHKYGIYASPENTPLELLSYKTLKYLLAVKKAVSE